MYWKLEPTSCEELSEPDYGLSCVRHGGVRQVEIVLGCSWVVCMCGRAVVSVVLKY
jgi:hypothetical protein